MSGREGRREGRKEGRKKIMLIYNMTEQETELSLSIFSILGMRQ